MSGGRPARAPGYRIALSGQVITPRIQPRLHSLTLIDQCGDEEDMLTLQLTDDDRALELPPRGAELELSLGWQDEGLVDRGTFIVDEVGHRGAPDILIIRARSADNGDSWPERKSRSWHEQTIAEVIETIAQEHDVGPAVSARFADILVQHMDQADESDMELLHRIAGRHDAFAGVKAGRLLFVPRGSGLTASGSEIDSITLRRSDGDRHRYQEADRDRYTGVIAHWHDVETARQYDVLVGEDNRVKRLRDSYVTEDEAREAAEAEMRRLNRGEATFSLTLAEGRPELYPETPVRLRGWKRQVDEREWVVSEVQHRLTDSRYTSQVQLEAPSG